MVFSSKIDLGKSRLVSYCVKHSRDAVGDPATQVNTGQVQFSVCSFCNTQLKEPCKAWSARNLEFLNNPWGKTKGFFFPTQYECKSTDDKNIIDDYDYGKVQDFLEKQYKKYKTFWGSTLGSNISPVPFYSILMTWLKE